MLAGRGINSLRNWEGISKSSGEPVRWACWYEYRVSVTGASLSNIGSSINLVSDCSLWTVCTTARGIIWSNSRRRKSWLDPSLPGVWVCDMLISLNSQVQRYFSYKVLLRDHYYPFMLELQQINSRAEYESHNRNNPQLTLSLSGCKVQYDFNTSWTQQVFS